MTTQKLRRYLDFAAALALNSEGNMYIGQVILPAIRCENWWKRLTYNRLLSWEEIAMNKQSASPRLPVTISPDAAARVAELGMQTELQQMIEHTRQVVPDLEAIEVEVAERYDLGGEPGVSIIAYSDRPFIPEDNTSWEVRQWAVETFPPQVLQHLCILLTPGRPNAG